MRISEKDRELLLSRLHIEDVVGEFVQLKKSGSNYKGLCPFHEDTNPSFFVNPAKNICHCFVCDKGGNPITFYQKYFREKQGRELSFAEAAGELAQKYNIPIRILDGDPGRQDRLEKYYRITADAHRFYRDNIFENAGKPALEYLSRRKMDSAKIEANKLGYATTQWAGLHDYLINKGYEREDLLALGLVRQGEKGYYDFFRGRIIFPIYNQQGRVIAFGGRTIETGEGIPKYINSSDNPIFHKGKNLYGLERGRIIKEREYAILMEGYMDVLTAVNHGLETAVAPLGTALTEEQALLLKNYTPNILLCLDMDGAGRAATERAGFILLKAGFTYIRVIEFQGAKDPDEFLNTYGKSAFLQAVEKSREKDFFDYLYAYYAKDYDLTLVPDKSSFAGRFREFFSHIPDAVARDGYIGKLSRALEIEKDALAGELIAKNEQKEFRPRAAAPGRPAEPRGEDLVNPLETETLADILADPQNFRYYRFFDITGSLTKKIFQFLDENETEDSLRLCMGLREMGEIDERERETLEDLICRSIGTSVNDRKKRETRTAEIIKAWFTREIKRRKKETGDNKLKFQLLALEDKMKNCIMLEDVLRIYREYEGFVFQIS